MIAALIPRVVALSCLCWMESSDNPFLFCYRIGWTLFAGLRGR
jgi:hypothetical protein